MEEKRGTISHFSGIIRLIAFIVLVVILLFFVFRWAANRRAENRAEEAVKTAVNHEDEEDQSTDATKKEDEQNKQNTEETQGIVEVPGGVAESEATTPTASVPSAGMGEDVMLTAIFASFAMYLTVKNNSLHKQLKQLV